MKRFPIPFDLKQTPAYVLLYGHLPRIYWGVVSILTNQRRKDANAMPN
jgi:hypothetical protein